MAGMKMYAFFAYRNIFFHFVARRFLATYWPMEPVSFDTLVQRFTGVHGIQAGLLVLAPKVHSDSGPIATMGSAMPPDTIIPKGAGIYDENGMLPKIEGKGLEFIAYA
jgi:hypothetical protein